ncbi:putative reverse transcriptase domain-containing protein, partial [Tanacetum coccineum]
RRTYDMVVRKWKTVRPVVVQFYRVYGNVIRMAHESGAGDEDYVQKAMIHYQAETGLPFKFRHCWDVLKNSPKFKEIAFPNFNQGSEGSSKRRKSSSSSSFNTESEDANINLNTTVVDEDDVRIHNFR